MGREVRKVPKDWKHPEGESLLEGPWEKEAEKWDEEKVQWDKGFRLSYIAEKTWVPKDADENMPFEEWSGERPVKKDYMPTWKETEKTHLQMYETCSEGSPISPVMKTPEELAHWLVMNEASSFASQTATYDAWLRIAKGGYACSGVIVDGIIESGVQGLTKEKGNKNA